MSSAASNVVGALPRDPDGEVVEMRLDSRLSLGHLQMTRDVTSIISDPREQSRIWFRLCSARKEDIITFCQDILNGLEGGNFNESDFFALREILDIDCVWLLRKSEPTLPRSLVVRAAVLLSGQHIKYYSKDSCRMWEWQLRAFESALCLLKYQNIKGFLSDTLAQLRRNCDERFRDIQRQQRSKLAGDILCGEASSYLLRLASDDLNIFQSDEPVAVTWLKRVLNVVFAAGLAYSVDAQGALEQLNQAFQPLRNRKKEKYKSLSIFYEVTRMTRIIFQWAEALDAETPQAQQLFDFALQLATLSVKEMIIILNELPHLETQSSPSWASTGLDYVNATLGRASQLNDYFYMYGILDNVAQLAKIFPIERLAPAFPTRLLELLEKSQTKKIHAKSIQILLANPRNRSANADAVRKEIHKSLWTKYISSDRKRLIAYMEPLVTSVQSGLDEADADIGSFWQSLKDIVEDRLSPPSDPLQQAHPVPEPFLPDASPQPELASGEFPPVLASSPSRDSVSTQVQSTSTIPDVEASNAPVFPAFDIQHSSVLHSYTLDKGRFGMRQKNYIASGISLDCRYVFFMSDKSASVFEVPEGQSTLSSDPLLSLPASSQNLYLKAAIGCTLFALIVGSACRVHSFANQSPPANKSPFVIELPNWNPKCIAICERGQEKLIAVGWGRDSRDGARGQITIHSLDPTLPKITLLMLIEFADQIKDYPKTLKFSHDMNMIACSTKPYNYVFVYRFSDNHTKYDLLCQTQRDFFNAPGVEGITSATVFESPWGRPYILCTASHSPERARNIRNGGEYSFLAPADRNFPAINSPLYHCLTQFAHLSPLQDASVPAQGNVAAFLDRKGRIYLTRLLRSASDGLESEDSLHKIQKELSSHLERSAGSIQFDPTGRRLLAADNKGNVVAITFTGNSLVPSPSAAPALEISVDI